MKLFLRSSIPLADISLALFTNPKYGDIMEWRLLLRVGRKIVDPMTICGLTKDFNAGRVLWLSELSVTLLFPWYNDNLTSSLDAFMPCPCQYFTIVFVLFFVAVAVSSHLCVICHHFNCLTLLLCGHVGFRNITLTGPHYSHLHVPFLEESNFCFRYQPFEL